MILVIISGLAGIFLIYKDLSFKKETSIPPSESSESVQSPASQPVPTSEKPISTESATQTPVVQIKSAVNLEVPFTSQAPYAIWDELHNEACEEAALITVNHYLKGERGAKISNNDSR